MHGRPRGGNHDPAPAAPFTHETAVEKVRLAEDAWNTRDPERVGMSKLRIV